MADSWGETEVIRKLFVGDLQDAQRFEGLVINVLPDVPDVEPAAAVHMPILRDGIESMNRTAEFIDAALARGERVLVHCEEGCERAPLVVAWFLKSRRGMTLDEAYQLLKSRRAIVADRRRWLGRHGD
ncbi:MAG TPA: dual specificity protein phosphatase [Candidatus Binataceae bacterium]|nr:dual specificity protein phosphatase [Candidatus Binataceae bacterium]